MVSKGRKNVVVIGAGTGMAQLLAGLRAYYPQVLLKAIVGVTDNGGHSGKLRGLLRDSGTPCPQMGDGRKCILDGLATKKHIAETFRHRLPDGSVLGNATIASFLERNYSLFDAFNALGKLVGVQDGNIVIPSTEADVQIMAKYNSGDTIIGEWEIIEHNSSNGIIELSLNRSVEATPASIAAIQEANYIIIGPGSLRTGIVSALLPKGIKEAITASEAPLIYVCNLMSQPGQTDCGFTAADHLAEIERYAGRMPGILLFNNGHIPQEVLEAYENLKFDDSGKPTPSYPIDLGLVPQDVEVISKDFIPSEDTFKTAKGTRVGNHKKWTHLLTHDSIKLSRALKDIMGL